MSIIPATKTALCPDAASRPAVLRPPAWVTSAPDEYGNYNGPIQYLSKSLILGVVTSWSAHEGPKLWLDYSAGDITPKQARELAAHLVRIADVIDPAGAEDGWILPDALSVAERLLAGLPGQIEKWPSDEEGLLDEFLAEQDAMASLAESRPTRRRATAADESEGVDL